MRKYHHDTGTKGCLTNEKCPTSLENPILTFLLSSAGHHRRDNIWECKITFACISRKRGEDFTIIAFKDSFVSNITSQSKILFLLHCFYKFIIVLLSFVTFIQREREREYHWLSIFFNPNFFDKSYKEFVDQYSIELVEFKYVIGYSMIIIVKIVLVSR